MNTVFEPVTLAIAKVIHAQRPFDEVYAYKVRGDWTLCLSHRDSDVISVIASTRAPGDFRYFKTLDALLRIKDELYSDDTDVVRL